MTSYNVYDKLYTNTKNRFTVVSEDSEYTLGDYMRMKAGKKKQKTKHNTVRNAGNSAKAISAFFAMVNDKLTVKNPPKKDETIKSFPLKTTLAAILSAVTVCCLIFSICLI